MMIVERWRGVSLVDDMMGDTRRRGGAMLSTAKHGGDARLAQHRAKTGNGWERCGANLGTLQGELKPHGPRQPRIRLALLRAPIPTQQRTDSVRSDAFWCEQMALLSRRCPDMCRGRQKVGAFRSAVWAHGSAVCVAWHGMAWHGMDRERSSVEGRGRKRTSRRMSKREPRLQSSRTTQRAGGITE